ncbi:hypothetical protein SJPD1_1047 [Sulfurospirillum diekertiae]|uniref:Uncharacterized protein n=1 Tax=Sulfurospirillum diekertiae TaxID=1854492 RepID=A0A290HST2_9BACT|nr:hypothetical protein [Sulfurospirillum diekertiae]ATB68886.1 hypothetical protein SJPD1_0772 [Sulfurospirillum diekertiae]ATB69159.1 hypothetical protein SJPD1_1047 [Sulfurospirillum diekertiae]
MGQTLIKNKLGAKTSSFNLPCDDTVASAFCASFLEGEYVGYALNSTTGTDTPSPYNLVNVVISNTLGLKTYLSMAVKSNKSEDEIYTALTGLTFNGVKADNISIISMRSVA